MIFESQYSSKVSKRNTQNTCGYNYEFLLLNDNAMKKLIYLPLLSIILSSCSSSTTYVDAPNAIHLSGTIVENPAHLSDQTNYMLIDSNQNKLISYIESTTVALGDFVDRAGTVDGLLVSQNNEAIPTITVTTFTPGKPLTEEDILLGNVRRESKKAPYNYSWDQSTNMIILQRDNSNGSAQIQVQDTHGKYVVSLVKNESNWHIADIKQVEYSSGENSSSTGSTIAPVIP